VRARVCEAITRKRKEEGVRSDCELVNDDKLVKE